VTIWIFFAYPLVVGLLSIPILGEQVGLRRLGAIALGFVCVLVIAEPWGAGFHWAMLLSLGAMVTAALYFVLTRAVAGADTNATSQFFTAGIATLILAPVAVPLWVQPAGAVQWAVLCTLGLLGFSGHVLLTHAYRFVSASTLAPVIYVQIFYAVALSWLVFGVLPGANTYLGAAIIMASGLYIWMRERRLATPPAPRVPPRAPG